MKKLYLSLLLCLIALSGFAQTNGNLQYLGDKAILQVWGTHYQRGHAQGYLLGDAVLDVFNQYYYTMVTNSDPVYYNFMWNYYQEHFDTDPRLLSEAQGLIAGLQDAGVNIFHAGLGRDLGADDLLLANAVVDMILVRRAFALDDLEIGCASLSSWGVSTAQDSLLAGSSVITRFLDWSQNTALIGNPLLVVHHPAEADEQEWLSFTWPGFIGALSAISASGTSAWLNMGNDHSAPNPQNLSPVAQDLRRGIERLDINADGNSDALDVYAAISGGTHLSGTIIHALSEGALGIIPLVAETNNSGTALRYYDNNGNLPGNHLAATNHFRVLANLTCCTRYANIQDSLFANHHMTAKRQWSLLSGAAGLETNLSAMQYTPSTGYILWSSATLSLPAYQSPAQTFSASALFDYPVAVDDALMPGPEWNVACWPNPLNRSSSLNVKSSQPFAAYQVFNLRGQKVAAGKFDQVKTELGLNLPDLPSGLYMLRLSGRNGETAQKKIVLSN